MPSYEIVLSDDSRERIADASGYQLEGPMTTFFRSTTGRSMLDCWSERLASYRSADVRRVRRIDGDDPADATTRLSPWSEDDPRLAAVG